MRSVFVAITCVALSACAVPVETGSTDNAVAVSDISASPAEPVSDREVGESAQCQSSPFGQCEDLCMEIYLAEIVQCQLRYPPRQRRPCYEAAAERLGACLKRCKD